MFHANKTASIPILFLLSFSIMMMFGGQALAQNGSVTAEAVPDNETPLTGEQIHVAINIDMTQTDELLGSYTSSLTWDPTILEYVEYTDGTTSGWEGATVNEGNVASGTISFSKAYANGSTGIVNTLNITFNVISAGTSTLDLEYSAMAAAKTYIDLLPILTVNDGSVTASEPAPVADFVGDPTSGDKPLTVQFTDQSTGTVTSWSWDFGDGGTSTEQNPSHTYNDAGTYTVSLTVTGPGGSDDEVKNDYINVTEPDIAVEPSSHDYGDVEIGTSASQTFVVSNEGTSDLEVTSVSLVGTNANEYTIASGGDPFNLAPGATHDVIVDFSPSSEGSKSATLRFESNDPDENPLDVALSGNGVAAPVPDIAVSPSSYDYGDVEIGSSSSNSFAVTNDGTADLSVTAVSLVGTNASEFSIVSGGDPFTVAPGDTHFVDVSFNPTSEGSKSATLRFESNDPDENPLDVALSGNGVMLLNAEFSANPTEGNAPLTVHFTDESSGTITSWSWNFGDGNTSTEQNPTHVYDSAGTYTVSLSVTGPSGSDTETKTDYITVTEGSQYCDDFEDGDANDWEVKSGSWDVVDGQYDGTNFTGPGLSLSPFGEIGSGSVSVDWTSIPGGWRPDGQVVFAYVDSRNYRYIDMFDGRNEWAIREYVDGKKYTRASLDENINTSQQYGIDVNIAGDGTVSLVVDGHEKLQYQFNQVINGKAGVGVFRSHSQFDNFCLSGQVLSPPVAGFSGDPLSGCSPLTVNFTDESTGDISSWQWDFGDGTTSSEQNPSHEYAAPGIYTVSLTVEGDGGSDTETKEDYITVNGVPNAEFSGEPTSGTVPLSVQFTDQSSGNPTTWEWDFGDGATSTEQNPLHEYTADGDYTVTLTVTNTCGADTETKVDYIHAGSCLVPEADFTADYTSGSEPLTVSFTDQSTNNPNSWNWDFGDGATSTEQNPVHEYTSIGTYTVSLTATNDCGSDTEIKEDYITVTGPSALHVESIEVTKETWLIIFRAKARIRIVDENGVPVEGATVTGEWSDGVTGQSDGETDSDGWATTYSNWRWGDADFTFCVTDVSKDGYVYDSEANVVTCGTSDGSVTTLAGADVDFDKIEGQIGRKLTWCNPNPFNPTTTIHFILPKAAPVKVEIYDILGKRIVTLVDHNLNAGIKSIVWNARDSRGQAVGSGTYFYRITIDGSKTIVRKLLLLK